MILIRDNRRGGVERLSVVSPDEPIMFLPEVLQQTAVLIGFSDPSRTVGTGFFLRTFSQPYRSATPTQQPDEAVTTYVVTAAHNIGRVFSDSDDVWLTFTRLDGTPRRVKTRAKDWYYHPTERHAVDVAVAEVPDGTADDNMTIDLNECATYTVVEEEAIGLGDQLYIAGLFNRLTGTHANVPIVRTGNIAMMPSGPIDTLDQEGRPEKVYAYLIETRSVGGLSGSPVFVHLAGPRKAKDWNQPASIMNPPTFLLGLIHGHWNLDPAIALDATTRQTEYDEMAKINTGIALVVPAEKILEVVNQKHFTDLRRAKKMRELSDKAPVLDSAAIAPDPNEQAKSMIDTIANRTERPN